MLFLFVVLFMLCPSDTPSGAEDLLNYLPADDYHTIVSIDFDALRRAPSWQPGRPGDPFRARDWLVEIGLPAGIDVNASALLIASTWSEHPVPTAAGGRIDSDEALLFRYVAPLNFAREDDSRVEIILERWTRPVLLLAHVDAAAVLSKADANAEGRAERDGDGRLIHRLATKPGGEAFAILVREDVIAVATDLEALSELVMAGSGKIPRWKDSVSARSLATVQPRLGPIWSHSNHQLLAIIRLNALQANGCREALLAPQREIAEKDRPFSITTTHYGDIVLRQGVSICSDERMAEAEYARLIEMRKNLEEGKSDPRILPPEYAAIYLKKQRILRDGLLVIHETLMDDEWFDAARRYEETLPERLKKTRP